METTKKNIESANVVNNATAEAMPTAVCHVLKFVYTILWYSIFFSLSGMPDKLKSFLLYCYRLSLG